MTIKDVRDPVRQGFEFVVEQYGVKRSELRHCALALLAVLDGQQVSLTRPAHHHNPDADWHKRRDREQVGDQAAGAQLARTTVLASLYGTGTCPVCRLPGIPLTRDGALSDHPPADADPELGDIDCVGGGGKPRPELAPTTTKADI